MATRTWTKSTSYIRKKEKDDRFPWQEIPRDIWFGAHIQVNNYTCGLPSRVVVGDSKYSGRSNKEAPPCMGGLGNQLQQSMSIMCNNTLPPPPPAATAATAAGWPQTVTDTLQIQSTKLHLNIIPSCSLSFWFPTSDQPAQPISCFCFLWLWASPSSPLLFYTSFDALPFCLVFTRAPHLLSNIPSPPILTKTKWCLLQGTAGQADRLEWRPLDSFLEVLRNPNQ
jgi:hypothetical protein